MNHKFETETACTTDQIGCPTVSYQDVNICIPVFLGAKAEAAETFMDCGCAEN